MSTSAGDSQRGLESGLRAPEGRYAVVAARFHAEIVDRLLTGAVDCLERHGAASEAIDVHRVPGAWELGVVAEELAASGRFVAIVALGAVVRGETPHFDFVTAGATDSLARVAERHRLPVGYGVLTCDDMAQAEARAGGAAGNKGWEAALAVLETAELLGRLRAEAS